MLPLDGLVAMKDQQNLVSVGQIRSRFEDSPYFIKKPWLRRDEESEEGPPVAPKSPVHRDRRDQTQPGMPDLRLRRVEVHLKTLDRSPRIE